MDSFDRMKNVINSRKTDRVPVVPFVMQYAAEIGGINYRDYCTDSVAMANSQLECRKKFSYDAVNVSSDPHRLAEALGGKLNFPENGVPSVIENPIESTADLKNFDVPDPLEEERCLQRIEAIEIIKDKAPDVPVIGWVEGALSDASSIFGVKKTLMAFHRNEEFLEELFQFCMEFDLKFAEAQIEAGADIIGAGDSLASQVSSENFMLSIEYTKKIFNQLSVPTIYHVCGDTTHQLLNLKSSQADIIDLDWQVDLSEARNILNDDICIRGNINPVLFVRGEPSEIKELSLQCIEEAGTNGNFILSAGCEIPPNTKEDNLTAMIKAAKKHEY